MKAVMRDEREMKDSGVKWIGKIPQQWNSKKIKYIANLYTGNSISDNEKDFYSDPIDAHPYIATKHIDMDDNSVEYENGLYVKDLDDSFKVALPNSTLMCIEGGSAGKKKALVNRTVSFVNKLCCFKATEKKMDKYLYYFLMSPNYEENFRTHITGLIGGVSVSELKNIPIAEPPCDERVLIANYLDDRCSKIDAIIAEAKASIEEYKELKQAVIYEAVTKGLDKNVAMKDSGVEWIGKTPKKWGAPHISQIAYVYSGGTPNRNHSEYWNGSIPWLKTGELKNNEIYSAEEFITQEGLDNSSAMIFPENTILMAMYGQGKTRGTTAILKTPCATNQACAGIILSNNKIDTEFLWICLMGAYDAIRQKAVGAGQPNLSLQLIGSFQVTMPSLNEQRCIVEYVKKKNSIFEELISEKQSLITDLEAYKKSLIYEVVTGKRKVVA